MNQEQSVTYPSVLPKKDENPLIVVYCLLSCEIFFIFKNFRIPGSYLEHVMVPVVGSYIAAISAFLLCVLALIAYTGFHKKINDTSHLKISCIVAALAPVAQFVLGELLGQTWVIFPCVIMATIGAVGMLPAIILRLVAAGVSSTVRCNVAACLVLLFAAPFSNLAPASVFACTMAIIPPVILYFFSGSKLPKRTNVQVEKTEEQSIPKTLMLTILCVSVIEGVVAAADFVVMSNHDKMIVFTLGYVASAVVILFILMRTKSNYNRVIFRVCIPIMVVGLTLFAFADEQSINIGTFIFVIGRQLFVATIMALIVYLVRYRGSDYYLLSFSLVVGSMLGSCFGFVLYRSFVDSTSNSSLPVVFIMYLAVAILLASLYLMSASNEKTCWGMIEIDDAAEKSGITFEQFCLILAEHWSLTKRESEIVDLLAKGRDRQAIAKKLYISEGTVKVHMRNIYQKMDVHSKQELIDLLENTEEFFRE